MIVDIDFVADFVCPWCLLGKLRLARALDELRTTRPDLEARVNWLPFFLDPNIAAAGEPYRAHLEAKFGGAARVDAAHASVQDAATVDGVQFAFERIQRRPNTLAAHRLLYRAQARGQTQAEVNALGTAVFEAFFQHGIDIGDPAALADLAAAHGSARATVLDYLNSDEDVERVTRLASSISRQGVQGVPFFIFNRRLAMSGAQSAAVLGAAILQALETAPPS